MAEIMTPNSTLVEVVGKLTTRVIKYEGASDFMMRVFNRFPSGKAVLFEDVVRFLTKKYKTKGMTETEARSRLMSMTAREWFTQNMGLYKNPATGILYLGRKTQETIKPARAAARDGGPLNFALIEELGLQDELELPATQEPAPSGDELSTEAAE